MKRPARPQIEYAAGRGATVVLRPLLLFLVTAYFAPATAEGLAVAFLASSIGLILTAADPHRPFYARHFEGEQKDFSLFFSYAASVAILMAVGAGLVMAIVWYLAGSLLLGAAVVLYFVSEKLRDEIQRYHLFGREIGTWGRAALEQTALQAILLAALALATGAQMPATLAVLALAASNFVVFARHGARSFRGRVPESGPVLGVLRDAGAVLSASRIYWVVALLGASLGYLDRLFALTLQKEILPLFLLVVMSFSVIVMAVDFFYVSQFRRDFLQRRLEVDTALRSPRFLVALAGGLGVALIAVFGVLRATPGGSEFPLSYVMGIAVLQSAVAVSSVPREIAYWRQPAGRLFRVEATFGALLFVVGAIAWGLRIPPGELLGLLAACTLLRLGLYIVLARLAPTSLLNVVSPPAAGEPTAAFSSTRE